MSIRSNTLPQRSDLATELQDILRRNGMQAHIVRQGDACQLAVQSHDSPLLTYPIDQHQVQALTDWGTNSANRKAYDTFASLVARDFDVPRNFVHARNANGRVAMGLHGYRVGIGEPERPAMDRRGGMRPDMMGPQMLGWTPRQQDGFHARRVGRKLFMQDAPMIPERANGHLRPGELQSGAYGFYYKGQQTVQQPSQDVLQNLQAVITHVETRPRPKEDAKPYKDLITSNVYFTSEKWQECLTSHGLVVDPDKKTLTVQSSSANQDFVYDLTDDELKAFTSNSLKERTLQSRLDTINNVIKSDFDDKVTLDMLNSNAPISIKLRPEVEAELHTRQQMLQDPITQPVAQQPEDSTVAHVDGKNLYDMNENKGWFREGRHGREVMVDDIKVEPVRDAHGEQVKDDKGEAKYRMTAVINGETVSHEITQKQYDKFMAIDDYHRMKLFSHIFHEVDMKNVPGIRTNIGAKIGGALMAGLSVMGELAHGIDPHHSGPSLFMEHHEHTDPRPHVYFKAGVDSPQELAARAFDAGLNVGTHGVGLGR